MRIEQLGFQIGCPMTILDADAKKYQVQLIVFSEGEGLIISAPKSALIDRVANSG